MVFGTSTTKAFQTKTSLSFMDVVRFAAKYWVRQPGKFTQVLFFLVLSALFETYLPNALSTFLAGIRESQSAAFIGFSLLIYLGVYLLQALFSSAAFLIYNVFETHIFKLLIDDVFAHILRLPENFFVNTFTGSIISKINRARQSMETFEDQIIIRIFPTFIVLISSTVFLAFHFPMLAALIVIYMGILFTISAFLVFKISGPAQESYAAAQDGFGAHLSDSIGGMTTIKAYAQEKLELANFYKTTYRLRIKNVRAYLLGNTSAFIQKILLMGMLTILLGGGLWYLVHGKATVESMAYLVLAYTIMQSYVRDLGENIKNLLTSSYDLHAIMRLLLETPEVSQQVQTPDFNIQKGEIVFDHVTFTYPKKLTPIFKDLCISVRSGERVALVGHSGSGKTTFIRLLQCLYPIQSGAILIDGQNIALGSRFSLRSAISIVPQDPVLFHRSLRENIAYGKPNASLEEIQRAAEQANISEFITALPEQYETLVGERGIKLSGGERQRIAIARAILADRPILILDEATSSLDSASERAIQTALSMLTHGRTSIMIAHRLSTVLDADRILVFDQGKIVEEGTHDELVVKENGVYAGFFKLQSSDIDTLFLPPD